MGLWFSEIKVAQKGRLDRGVVFGEESTRLLQNWVDQIRALDPGGKVQDREKGIAS